MAGEWIKFEHATLDKPEVWQIATHLDIDPDAVVGKLLRVWAWFDAHTENGNAPSVTTALLDRRVGVTGFCDAMIAAGWMIRDAQTIHLPNFDAHNSKTAKTRANTARRVTQHRNRNAPCNAPTVTPSVTSALAREEKRRSNRERERDTDRPVVSVSSKPPTAAPTNQEPRTPKRQPTPTLRASAPPREPPTAQPPTPPNNEPPHNDAPPLRMDYEIPAPLRTPDFVAAWHAWIDWHTAEAGRPATEPRRRAWLSQLLDRGPEAAVRDIHYTIGAGVHKQLYRDDRTAAQAARADRAHGGPSPRRRTPKPEALAAIDGQT